MQSWVVPDGKFLKQSYAEQLTIAGQCEERLPPGNHPCPPGSSLDTAATNFCKKMLDSEGLHTCFSTLNPMPYFESCRWSYCEAAATQSTKGAPNSDSLAADFGCHSVESYVRACREEGIKPEVWRTSDFCRKHRTNIHTKKINDF